MKRYTFIIIAIISFHSGFCQQWRGAGKGVNNVVYDLIKFKGKLYSSGRNGVASWDGTKWEGVDKLLYMVGYSLALTTLNDTLYVSDELSSKVYKHNGSTWVQVGSSFSGDWTGMKSLLTYKGQLISGGHFSWVNDSIVHNIAYWNGKNWVSLGKGLDGTVYHLTEHKGNLYASGTFLSSGGDSRVRFIAKWNGEKWMALDTTHKLNSGGGPMISFDSSLIITLNDTISGIPMKGIAKWDGKKFVSLGNNLIRSVSSFLVFNNELYLSGTLYTLVPWVYDNVVLKWNGFFWTMVGDKFNERVNTLEDYNGELYSGGFFTKEENHVGRYNITTRNTNYLNKEINVKIYPNPSKGNLTLETSLPGNIIITNNLGQEVYSLKSKSGINQINFESLSKGIYHLIFNSNNGAFNTIITIQ